MSPSTSSSPKTLWVAVSSAADLAPESARVVQAGGLELALVRGAQGLYALDNICPHSGGPLGEGMVQGETLTCPLHGWQFECNSGRCLNEKAPLRPRYTAKIENGQVLIEVPNPDYQPSPQEAEESPSGGWYEALPLSDLPKGTLRKLSAGGHQIALGHGNAGVFAIADACAHEGGSLGEGSLEGDTVTCPLHGWKFFASSGACQTDPRFCQQRFETKIENGKICILLPEAPPQKKVEDPATARSSVELWKAAKHGLDCWEDILRFAREGTPMTALDLAELERMKWYGFFYRKANDLDHYMVRVRIPGSELSSKQMKALAFIAYESGYSLLDVTTRGNIQIQGLIIQKLPGVHAALQAVGLDARQSGHDNVRNVSAHPLSGLDPEEILDTRPLARELTALILGNRAFSDLPRKFNLATYGRPDAAAHAWTQDICFVANRDEEGAPSYHLLLGGSQGQTPTLAWCAPVWVAPQQAVDVAAAVLQVFHKLGYRHNRHQVRFHFLMERLGNDAVLGEIEKELGYRLRRTEIQPSLPKREEQNIGWFEQKQKGRFALGICVPVGRLSWDQSQGLAELSERFGSGTLRTTLDQNLIIPDIRAQDREETEMALAALGLSTETDAFRRSIVSCTGKQFCNLAITETKGFALRLMDELRRRHVSLRGIGIHFSGCPNSCGMTMTADVGLQGNKVRVDGAVTECFDVYLGGGVGREGVRLAKLWQKAVPFKELAYFLEKLIRQWHVEKREGESFSDFWRVKLEGHQPAPLSQRPARWDCGKCGYRYVGEVPPSSCPICSAIRSHFEPAGDSAEPSPRLVPPASKPSASPAGPPRHIVIVGGSIAAHHSAQEARKHDPAARISIVCDEAHGFYNRLNLTRFLNREVERQALFEYGSDWYKERRVELLAPARTISLDPNERRLLLEDGRSLPYDACILAHGASPILPPFYRELEGLRPLRTLADVEHVMAGVAAGVECVVVGGGVLGIEAALGLAGRNAKVTVLEIAPRLMPRQLVEDASRRLQARLESKNVAVRTSVRIRALLGEKRLEGIELEDSTRLPCTLGFVSTGIQPNCEWVKSSGIDCQKGVVVDDQMRTNAPGVFACGDVAEWRGQVVGLWSNALEQAAVAAASACGKAASFAGFLALTQLKCLGWEVISIGDIAEDGGDIQSRTEEEDGIWKRVIFRNGFPVGGILLGGLKGLGDLRALVDQGKSLERLAKKVLPPKLPVQAGVAP